MPNHPARPVEIPEADLEVLRSWAAGHGPVPASRAQVLLLAAEGRSNTAIAEELGLSRPTVLLWRRRYGAAGVRGLHDRPKRGRTPHLDDRQIVTATLEAPPRVLRTTQWSTRLLAEHLGVGRSTVARAWKSYGIRPRGAGTFHFATEPELVAYVTDVVGLAISPAWSLAALRVHDASGRSLNRHAGRDAELASGLAPITAYAALRAALDAPTPEADAPPLDLTAFLDTVRDAHPPYRRRRPDLALVLHATPPPAVSAELATWLARHPQTRVHHASDRERWLNLLEAFLTLVELPATRRGAVGCVPELDELLRHVVEGRSDLTGPFVWTATPRPD